MTDVAIFGFNWYKLLSLKHRQLAEISVYKIIIFSLCSLWLKKLEVFVAETY